LRDKLARLNHVPRRRIATKPSRASKKRRLADKAHDARKKDARRRPSDD
jgi:hypothetical protein